MTAETAGRLSQFRKGALELAILALLDRGELYGVEIVERLAELPGLAITAGTVYPLLSRLKKAGLVASVWRESPVGPPRKYYRLTRKGERELVELARAWTGVSEAIDALISEVAFGD
ncbi:MAG: PadR family transcriptional regulator [Anaerosomatales bacterium]|nr:PadR family transcriptional regulator [Anaerosomatales bacterium]